MKTGLLERYESNISGVLGCFDRIVVSGTLTEIAYPGAMAGRLASEGIRCFDIMEFAEPLRLRIRENALKVAAGEGVQIQHLSKSKGVRKEELVAGVLAGRGTHPGLVHVISVMEGCTCFKPWHDKSTGKTGLRMMPGKCLTYYFYLIDPELGLMYVRVPTWLPFRLQIYFNGHNWLARELEKKGVAFEMEDNAFVHIGDWEKAREAAHDFSVRKWERKFRQLAKRFCPVEKTFRKGYHWTTMQVEYALDVVFNDREVLSPLYEQISRQAILAVKVPDMARFWGKRFSAQAEAQSDFKTVVEGTRIKHTLGKQSIKMYDKGSRVLRIEATSNDITFFSHHRKVVGRDGNAQYKMAALKKSIYSLSDLIKILNGACRRYLDFAGNLEDTTPARHDINKISRTVRDQNERTWRGFNLFLEEDQKVVLAILQGEFNINGLSNRRLRLLLPDKTSGQISRILKRLRNHGMIKKVGKTYRYYVTHLGKRLLIAGRKLFENIVLPNLMPQKV